MNRRSGSVVVALRISFVSAVVALIALFVGTSFAQEPIRARAPKEPNQAVSGETRPLAMQPTAEMSEGDAAEHRNEWFYGQRAKPYGKIPAGVRERSLELLDQRETARRHAILNGTIQPDALSTSVWTAIGPQPTATTRLYTSSSGRVEAIAVDPRSVSTVYLGTALGGVWKTTDGGAHWTALFDQQKSMAIGAIAIDPSAPDTVYVATGEGGALAGFDTYYGAGIFKSTNGGTSWTQIGTSFIGPAGGTSNFCGGAYISSLAVQPNNSQVLLATAYSCTGFGVYRSTDAGNTWTLVKQGLAYEVKFDLSTPSVAYTAFGLWNVLGISTGPTGFYKSTDGGATWNALNGTGANLFPTTNVQRVTFSVAASSPTTIYAGMSRADNTQSMGLWKTTDGGANWLKLAATGLGDYCTDFSGTTVVSAQCWFDNVISVHPKNPNVVFVGGAENPRDVPVLVSTDGGNTFTRATPTSGEGLHADSHALVFSNDGTVLYTGDDGGIWSTTNTASSAPSWTNLNGTLNITQFYPGIAINPKDSTWTFGGTQDNGTQQFANGTWAYFTCGDGGWNAWDSTGVTLYAACTGNPAIIKASVAGGSSVLSTPLAGDASRMNFVPPMVLGADDKSIYWASYRVWQSPDSGTTWNAISPDLTTGPSNGGSIISLAASPVDSKTVWALTTENGFAFAQVWVTHNATSGTAATWSNVTPTSGWPGRSASSVVADPTNASIAYVTFSGFSFGTSGQQITTTKGHVFKTTNGGASWVDISGDLETLNTPVNTIAVDPSVANTLYAATDIGVFVTRNGGTNWTQLGTGLPRVVVLDVKLHSASRTLRAATHGRGMWDISVSASTAAGSLGFSPSFLTFLNQNASTTSAPQTVTVTASNGAVAISSITSSTANFVVSNNNCITTVQSGASCTFQVSFAPGTNGAQTGTITITSNGTGSPQSFSVQGNGVFTGGVNVTPETGWWWDSSLNGTGFFIEYRPAGTGGSASAGVFVGGFIYDNSGNATWIITLPFNGVGTFTSSASGLTYSGNWLRCTNGQTLTGVWKQNACSVYTPVTINFTSSTTATMTRPDGTTISLARFLFSGTKTPQAGSPQSGWWWIDPASPTYNPGAGGTGYGIEIQGNAAFIVAYVYDGATGNPIWNLTTSGATPMTNPTVYSGTWQLFNGVPHWCTSASPACTPDGSYSTTSSNVTPVTINFTDATHATMTMGSTVIPITKFNNF